MKRFFDLIISFFIIFILALPMGYLCLKIHKKLGGPIFFRQTRPGLNGRSFKMIKFRTMTNECDFQGNLLQDELRLTPFGCWLRSTSLDELPELWNVLRGEMSLVGPRPLLMEYLPLYSPQQARRHEVLPGITGWAQINGRNALSWDDKFQLDLWYVNNRSIWLDIKIIFMTVRKVLERDGIVAKGEATMSKFIGNNNSEGLGS